MENETRTVCFDADLRIEAYRLKGITQSFPIHFHDFYVIGYIESGSRSLICNTRNHILNSGDITIFNPGDTHACQQIDSRPLDYRSINISSEVMKKNVLDITGKELLPRFTVNVLYHSELADSLRELHVAITESTTDFKKEELLLFLLGQLISEYTDSSTQPTLVQQEPPAVIKAVCEYMESNYDKSITLDELSSLARLSKYHLLRVFTRQTGISPYSYLETIRVGNAKKLLENGVPPVEAALKTGFSDQSHFTNFFKKLIGITPKQYMKIFDINRELKALASEELQNAERK